MIDDDKSHFEIQTKITFKALEDTFYVIIQCLSTEEIYLLLHISYLFRREAE